ncbi:MAG TPA: hypothetical protein VFR81_12025 [Longimicrobium sp.]|nr:hypothetical protein [Longimicrobium sp.]
MTLEVLSFGIGGVLIGIAVVGGGLELKEIKVPKVGAAGRCGAFMVGLLFVFMGIGMAEATRTPAPVPGAPAVAQGYVPPPPAQEPVRGQVQPVPLAGAAVPLPVDQREPAAAEPAFQGLTGRAHLSWNVYGAPYEAMIETSGRTGAVRVAFVGQSGSMEQVDQDLVLERGANLLFYRGMNPRYAGTSTPHPTYSPDSFRIVEMQTGVWSITEICDDRGACAPVQAQPM